AVGGAQRSPLDLVDGVDVGADLDGHRGLALCAATGGDDGAGGFELLGDRGFDDACVRDVLGPEGDSHPLFVLAGDLDVRDPADGAQFGYEVGVETVAEGGRIPAGDGEHRHRDVIH